MLNLHSYLVVLSSSFRILPFQKKKIPKSLLPHTFQKAVTQFPTFHLPSTFLSLRIRISIPEAVTSNLSDHLPLDNIAVQRPVPTNNVHKKNKVCTWGNCFPMGFNHQVSRNTFSESDTKKNINTQ